MAGRFRFRLEVVRRLRKQDRDEQRRVVAERVGAVSRVERRLVDLNEQLRGHVDQTRRAQHVERLSVDSLRTHHWYKGRLHREILETEGELTGCVKELDTERVSLADATRRLKVIEKLRERQWTRHQLQARREEQSANDEMALQNFGRRRTMHAVDAMG